MTKEAKKQWLIQKMTGINAHNGTKNCALVALRLDEILNEPETVYAKPVPVQDPHISTEPEYSDDEQSIIKSMCSDPRILARCMPKTIVKLDDTAAGYSEVDALPELTKLRFAKADSKTIKSILTNLPGRNKDGSAHGFILYTHKDKALGGHLTNFLVDGEDNVYFLDAQINDPETFVSDEPAAGYMDEIFYLQSHPTDGLQFNFCFRKEDYKMRETTTTTETSPVHGQKRTAAAAAGSSSSSAAASSSSYGKRKRTKATRLEGDFKAASKSSYSVVPTVKRDDYDDTLTDFHDSPGINDLVGAAGVPHLVSNPSQSSIANSTPSPGPTKKIMSPAKLGDVKGAIEGDLFEKFKFEIKGMDLNDLGDLKVFTSKKKECSLLRFIIDNNRFNFVSHAIKAGAKADLVCFEKVLKNCALRNNEHGNCIDDVVASLKEQNIKIPVELIIYTQDVKKVRGYGDDYIPELVHDFVTHNNSLLDLGSAAAAAASSTTTTTAAAEPKAAQSCPLVSFASIAVTQAVVATTTVAETPTIKPSYQPQQDAQPTIETTASATNVVETATLQPVVKPQEDTKVEEAPIADKSATIVKTAEQQPDTVTKEQPSAAAEQLIPAPSLASLRARLQTLKHSQQLIKGDFVTYEQETTKLLQASGDAEHTVTEYITAVIKYDRLKKELFDKVHEFKKTCEQAGDDALFFKTELPEMYQEYKSATDQKRFLELNLLTDLSSILATFPPLPNANSLPPMTTYSSESDSAAASTGTESAAKRLRISQQELDDPTKLEALIEEISSQHRKDINSCLSQYVANCKHLETLLPKLGTNFTEYRTAVAAHDAANNNLWRTVTKMFSNNEPNFKQEAALKTHCPDLSATYILLTEKRRNSRLGLQKHLHNTATYKQQKAASPGSPRKASSSSASAAAKAPQQQVTHRSADAAASASPKSTTSSVALHMPQPQTWAQQQPVRVPSMPAYSPSAPTYLSSSAATYMPPAPIYQPSSAMPGFSTFVHRQYQPSTAAYKPPAASSSSYSYSSSPDSNSSSSSGATATNKYGKY